jgi:hypothetical protein
MKIKKRTIGFDLYESGVMTQSFKGKQAERQLKTHMRTVHGYYRVIEKVRQPDGKVRWTFYDQDSENL